MLLPCLLAGAAQAASLTVSVADASGRPLAGAVVAVEIGGAARTAAAGTRAEVVQRWDIPAIHAQVLASQRARQLVGEANQIGKRSPWDYGPRRDAAEEYVRPHMDLEDLEAKARFPRVRF